MKKLLSLLLAAALVFTLSLPALAWEEPPTKYPSFDEYLDFYRASVDPETKALSAWLDAWIAAHPQEYAAFDADTYFAANIYQDNGVNKENWFAWQLPGYNENHFKAEMLNHWLTDLFRAAPALAYVDTDPPLWQLCLSPSKDGASLEKCLAITAMTQEQYAAMAHWAARYQAEHAETWDAFDPNAYYLAHSQETVVPDKAGWGGEAGFKDYMRFLWIRRLYLAYDKNRVAAEMSTRYPEDYAAFDADAWFLGATATTPGGDNKESYMEEEGFTTEEEFRLAMFGDWVAYSATQPSGFAVTVNGTPVRGWMDFNAAYPYAERGRILVSTPALMEPMGFTVERDKENRVLICTKGDLSITFAADERTYTLTRDGLSRTLALDVPPKSFGPDAPYYVPLRALAEALGYTVTWNQTFQTAQLTTSTEKD